MTLKMGKIYGIFFAIVGILIFSIDTILLGIESEFLRFSFNPLEIVGRYLDNIVVYSTRTFLVIASTVFNLIGLGFGIGLFLSLRKNLKQESNNRKWTSALILGAISAAAWFAHAVLLYNSFNYFYEHRKYVDVLLFWNTVILSLITILLFVIPSVKAKIFRRILAFALIVLSAQTLFDIVYFGIINVIIRHENAGVVPLLSLIAPLFTIAGGVCFMEAKPVLNFLEKADKSFNLSALFLPFVNIFDGKYETWAISDSIAEDSQKAEETVSTISDEVKKGTLREINVPRLPSASPGKTDKTTGTQADFDRSDVTGDSKNEAKLRKFAPSGSMFSSVESEKNEHPDVKIIRPGDQLRYEQIEDVEPLAYDDEELNDFLNQPPVNAYTQREAMEAEKNRVLQEKANAPSAPPAQVVRKGLFKSRKQSDNLTVSEMPKPEEELTPVRQQAMPDMDLFSGDEIKQIETPLVVQDKQGQKYNEILRSGPKGVQAHKSPEPQPIISDDDELDEFSKPLPSKKSNPVILIIAAIILVTAVLSGFWYFLAGPGKANIQGINSKTGPKQTKASQSPSNEKPAKNIQNDAMVCRDISKSPFNRQISALLKLGIAEAPEGKFDPVKPISKSQYIRWLVKANNTYMPAETGGFILPAAETDKSSFSDITSKHKDWQWIQGLANAGYDISFSNGKFAPDRKITRQEMVYIRCQIEYNMSPREAKNSIKNPKPIITALSKHYDDADKIKPLYLAAFAKDMKNGFAVIKSCFGTTRLIKPDKEVTREEAAASMNKIKDANAEALTDK